MQKAVVVGAGVAGLAAAVRLAVKGYAVTVYEANAYPGGKLSEIVTEGFRFDAGPSLFTMPELVDELFTLAGKDPSAAFQYERLDHLCTYYFADGTRLEAKADIELFAQEAAKQTGVDANAVRKHLKRSRFIYETTAHLFLERSLHKVASYLRMQTLQSILRLPFLGIFTTMDRANQTALGNAKMRQLFNRYATYNGSDPYRAPGILNIIPHLEFSKGAFLPKEGMHAITKAIHRLALNLGVEFQMNSPVQRIVIEQGKVKGVQVHNACVACDVLVCNMDVVPAYRKLMPEQKQPDKILRQERSSSALIFYWGIKHTFPELDLHNIFFTEDYAKEFETIFKAKRICDDPTVYVNITSKKIAADAPPGMENWFVMINVPANQGQNWDALISEARSAILQKLSKLLGKDIASLIVTEQILDPRSIESRTQSYQGALYGTSSNHRMAAFFRHPNFSNCIQGLYFCGGSVHPGGGIPLALSSAKIVDSLIPMSR